MTTYGGMGIIKWSTCGGVAQLARACGSYPQCRGFKSLLRYFPFFGPLVKRSRRGPLTAETRVRFPYGSLKFYIILFKHGSLAQLGEHLPYKQRVTGSSPVTSILFLFKKRNISVFLYRYNSINCTRTILI